MNELTYKEIVERLTINKHDLDGELEIQAAIQHMISEKLSKARQHMDSLENDLEIVEAKVFKSTAEQLQAGKKPSVDYVKHAVKSDTGRTRKWLDLNEARTEHEKWEGLYWSWQGRSDALKALASLAVANYFSVETTYGKKEGRDHRPVRRRETR